MTDGQEYTWTRRPGETVPAYEAFREYLMMGHDRTLRNVCDRLDKAMSIVSRWSGEWDWVERSRAYDVYLAEAETDGIVHALTEARQKNLDLVDKLRDHLSHRLDEFIEKRLDPTVRWTQALRAMAELEKNAFAISEDKRSREQMDRVTDLVARFEAALNREPEEA